METRPTVPEDLGALIDRWVAEGVVTAEQADLMRADAGRVVLGRGGVRVSEHRAGLAGEALGYLGGIIIVVALGLVTGTLWHDLSTGARLALAGGSAALLLLAGHLVPDRRGAPGARLRSVLWLASSAGMAAFLGLAGTEAFGWSGEAVAAVIGLGTALYSAVLWRSHRYPLQQAAVLFPLLVGVAGAAALLPDAGVLFGLAAWSVATAWLALAWGGLIPDREVGMVLGAVGAVGSSLILLEQGWGVALALTFLAALVLLAVAARDLVLLAVGSVGTLFLLPQTMARYFPGALAPALALLVVGVVLVATAVLTTRRRTADEPGRASRWSVGDARLGRWVAGGVLVCSGAIVLAAGTS
jgi:hypothetical protein